MMRFLIIPLLHLLMDSCMAQKPVTDGPFVTYRNQYMVVERVHQGRAQKDSLRLTKKNNARFVDVQVPGKESVFTVPLRQSHSPEPSEFPAADRIFVISDIEGSFDGLCTLLKAGRVMDDQFSWTFDDGHLVICGDMVDRGEDVTACLWLLYKLEGEAKEKGGYVHTILGNHEIMNLSEDFRYVNAKYATIARLLGKSYSDFYAPDTEIGIWMRSKNIVEKIGDILFLHAGISAEVNEAALPLQQINEMARPFYDQDGFDSVLQAADVVFLFDGYTSPFWYRGYFMEPLASRAQIDSTLKLYGVRHIIVGHTLMDQITPWYDGSVIAIDVNHHSRNHQALLIENGTFFRLFGNGSREKLE